MINYIEFYPRKKVWEQSIKSIHLPDIRSFEFILQNQTSIEDIELGSIANGISDELNLDEYKMDFIHSARLVKVVVYLDTSKECMQTVDMLNGWGTDKTAKFVYDEFGRAIDIDASVNDRTIVLRGE